MIDRITITSIGMPRDWLKTSDDMGKKIVKPVLQTLVNYWHTKFLPRHFRTGAFAKYNYKPRTARYLKRKQRMAEHGNYQARLPLVFTGALKSQVSRMISISGTGKKATGRMSAPRYIYMYGKGGNHPYLAGEVTTVSPDEAEKLTKLADDMMSKAMRDRTETTVTRAG